MTIHEIASIVRDMLVSGAAVITAVAAVVGLQSWRRELRGRTEFEAARFLVRATYKVRDEFKYCRAPFIRGGEFPPDYPVAMATADQEAEAWDYIYKNRWEPLRESLQEFESRMLEAEALWGNEVKKATDQLRQCARELQVAMESVIEDKAAGGRNFKTDREFGKDMRDIVSALPSGERNPFTKKINTAIEQIEKHVLPHLQRR